MQETVLFGTYTKKSSKGIYRAILNTDQKTLSAPKVFVEIQNPTYLRYSADNVLYTISKKDQHGGVASYALSSSTPTFQNEVLAAGAPPCYIGIDEEKQLVFTANYHEGTITVLKTDKHGKLVKKDEVRHHGSGPRPEQEKSHVHYTDLTPDRRLAVCDLGADKLYTYDVSFDGKLNLVAEFSTAAGFAPRHLVFHPSGKYAFLAGELSSKLALLAYDQKTGRFTHIMTVSTIPATWNKHNGAAAIRISQDGKFVYVSNRGHNSLAVFAFDAAKKHLDFIEYAPTQGDFPRDFMLDATGKFIVVANQNTDNATLLSRDTTTGKLTCIQKDITIPEGVCVAFID